MGIFGKKVKTVDGVLAALTATVQDLEVVKGTAEQDAATLAENRRKAIEMHENLMKQMDVEETTLRDESSRATVVIGNLKKLLGEPEQDAEDAEVAEAAE